MVLIGLILKSFVRESRLYILWIVSLSLAITALLTVDVFRQSLVRTLQVQGRSILSADLAVTHRRPLNELENSTLQKLTAGFPKSELIELTAMVRTLTSEPRARLANLRFVQANYPLAGELTIQSASDVRSVTAKDLGEKEIWLASDFLDTLGIKIGESLSIGELEFQVSGVIRKDATQTFRFANMAPRIYLPQAALADTKLMQFGSTYSSTAFFSVPENQEVHVQRELQKNLTDPAIQIAVPVDLEQGTLRVLGRLLDFLGLVGLVTLSLGWTGVYYLSRRWLSLEAQSVGILRSIGFSANEILRLLLWKLIFVCFLGTLVGALLAWLSAQVLYPLAADSLPPDFILSWSWLNSLLSIVVGPFCALIVLFPFVREIADQHPLELVESRGPQSQSLGLKVAFAAGGALIFFLVTLMQAKSWFVTGIFLGALLGSVILVAALSYIILRSLNGLRSARSWKIHLVASIWHRQRRMAVLMITVCALSGLLVQLIPHLQKTIARELDSPTEGERPAIFMFDIQDEQLSSLTDFLSDARLETSDRAPLIRARILKVNEQEFERSQPKEWSTREEENDARFRNRGVNLSYRQEFPSTNQFVAGKNWQELSRDPENLEVSVETGYARRLGLKLGDHLLFDIQGIEIKARVAMLRNVDWNRFEPNFFILFPEGVLNDAPKTWLLTIKRSAILKPADIQSQLASRFPSITSINVQEALDNASTLLAKMTWGLNTASLFCLLLGLFVFFMILLFQFTSGQKDWVQLKMLGLKNFELLQVQTMTYGGLATIGFFLGSGLSIFVGWCLTYFIFDSNLQLAFGRSILILVFAVLIGTIGLIQLAWRTNRSAHLKYE